MGLPVGNPTNRGKYPKNFRKALARLSGQGIEMTYALLRESGKKSKV